MKRRDFIAASAGALTAPWALGATELPKGIVKIYVGWAPGGGTDVFARIVGQQLSQLWGRSVVVENKPGATGALAADFFARTRFTEGVNLLMAHVNTHAISPHIFKSISYDPLKDFAPVAMVGATPHILVTRAKNSAGSVKEVVEQCRQSPGKISFGSSGTGSVQHLAAAMFNMAAEVKSIHVPYKGSGPMQTDLIGGQIDYSFDTMTAATAQVKAGRMAGIVQTRLQRAKGFPDMPTMDEQGFKGFDVSSWYGVVGPKDMSRDLALQINADINKVLALPDVVARFDGYGVEDGGGSVDKFAAFMAAEFRKWGEVVRTAKVTEEG
ncbi:tripartite-type tricarboxylate transporter receptor subunit TctC [Variovorax beijingensis]|uniref:Tripartite-type tricarboxylate transporter receptor subunit TctC n=2 Tax=Variovorax TaxID=34072 RepID=A0AAE4BYL6_VARPD|nr:MULTISPECIES: tripartite tricarboxylate transporter substrate binding protein [Variovorax]MDR6427174.1 tripartite-type tricarboxylate transporter receptor subunit TctC [Variovorax paradoxus]TWD91495.1 tripartite-type tricarboxylate transporter receptor subunit TctC [Variovorax beijingensis]